MILAGDIGGTKTRLALYAPGGSPHAPERESRQSSHAFDSLESMVRAFVAAVPVTVARAVFGIAGPVVENRCETTNLPWHVDGRSVAAALGGAAVTLLNDLEATAWGLEHVRGDDLVVLQPGLPARGNRALIAAGTGLGEALLFPDGERWRPSASEGGHADFGPRDAEEDELLQWLRARYGRVSYERILSGPGLADLHRFMTETGRGAEPAEVTERFRTAPDPAALVSECALDGSSPRARLTLERFVRIYGAEAGNLALKALAVGGVYVGGGIAPRIRAFLDGEGFVRAFTDKGRLSPLLARMPLSLVLDDRTALWGAAAVALAPPGD